MFAELTGKMKTAAAEASVPAQPTAHVLWGFSFAEILKVLVDQALQLGQEYREELQQAARAAVDAVVEFDLPLIPAGLENTLDEATRAAGYAAIDAVLNAILGAD